MTISRSGSKSSLMTSVILDELPPNPNPKTEGEEEELGFHQISSDVKAADYPSSHYVAEGAKKVCGVIEDLLCRAIAPIKDGVGGISVSKGSQRKKSAEKK